jgi:hypothetical protein
MPPASEAVVSRIEEAEGAIAIKQIKKSRFVN